MVRSLLASVALLLALCVSAAAHAAQGDIARYVLPPGNYGGIPTGPHSLDQLPLYSGLTPLRRNVSMGDVSRFYLPMNFSPIGTTQNEPVGRSDVTVTYDAYGIPHIKGKTRAGMMFGAGWVMARDRGLLLSFGRDPARAAVADIPGLDAFSLVTSATPFKPSAQAEALVTQQRQELVRAYGAEGRQMLGDMANYTDGVNAYYTDQSPPDSRWRSAVRRQRRDRRDRVHRLDLRQRRRCRARELGPARAARAEVRRPARPWHVERRDGGERPRRAGHDAQVLPLPDAHRREGTRFGRHRSGVDRALPRILGPAPSARWSPLGVTPRTGSWSRRGARPPAARSG